MTSKIDEPTITEENFFDYFKDVRKGEFEKGNIIAQYSAIAEFIDGGEKRQIISLLMDTENKMEATAQVMRKLLYASERDAYKVPRNMAEDLLSGMSIEDCAKKPYKYTLEMFFYARPENVPKNDPHWSIISIINTDQYDDAIKSRILSEDENIKLNEEKLKLV
jgi:hypothetical protein